MSIKSCSFFLLTCIISACLPPREADIPAECKDYIFLAKLDIDLFYEFNVRGYFPNSFIDLKPGFYIDPWVDEAGNLVLKANIRTPDSTKEIHASFLEFVFDGRENVRLYPDSVLETSLMDFIAFFKEETQKEKFQIISSKNPIEIRYFYYPNRYFKTRYKLNYFNAVLSCLKTRKINRALAGKNLLID